MLNLLNVRIFAPLAGRRASAKKYYLTNVVVLNFSIQSGIARSTRSILHLLHVWQKIQLPLVHTLLSTLYNCNFREVRAFYMIVQNQHDFVRIMKGLTIHDDKIQDLAASALHCRGNLPMLRCKRGFGSPRIWIPPFALYAIASRMMTSNFGSQIRRPQSADLAPRAPADLDPDSQRIVEDLFRQDSFSGSQCM